jgi:hypothetical protein
MLSSPPASFCPMKANVSQIWMCTANGAWCITASLRYDDAMNHGQHQQEHITTHERDVLSGPSAAGTRISLQTVKTVTTVSLPGDVATVTATSWPL